MTKIQANPFRYISLVLGLGAVALSVVYQPASAQPQAPPPRQVAQPGQIETILRQVPVSPQELEAARKLGLSPEEARVHAQLKGAGSTLTAFMPASFDPATTPVLTPPQIAAALAAVPNPNCNNGSFELGNPTNWVGFTGTFFGTTPVFTAQGWGGAGADPNKQHTILPGSGVLALWSGPKDPTVALGPPLIPLPFPGGGSRFLRLGNNVNGAQAEAAAMPFIASATNASFRFQYAMVMEDPGHAIDHQPRFIFQLLTSNGVVVPTSGFQRISSGTDPFFNKRTGLVWRRVSCFKVDIPPAYFGQKLLAVFANTDCALGGHFGYTYIDSVCDPNVGKPILNLPDKVCQPNKIVADGTLSAGVIDHSWTITETTDGTGATEVPGTKVTWDEKGEIKGKLVLNDWYERQGKKMVCGKFYKVTLRITTECSNESVSKIVFYDCCPPNLDNVCCGDHKFEVKNLIPRALGNGLYGFSPVLYSSITNANKVEVALVSAIQYMPRQCGPSGPVGAYFAGAGMLPGSSLPSFPGSPFSQNVFWYTNPLNLSGGITLPITLKLPAPPARPGCYDIMKVCVKITVRHSECRTCEFYQCFLFKRLPLRGSLEQSPLAVDRAEFLSIVEPLEHFAPNGLGIPELGVKREQLIGN